MNKKMSPTLVGAFVLGALALVVVGILAFGTGELFAKKYEFVLYFDSSVNGLNIGAPVKVRGVEIGTVTNILLSLDREKRLKEAAEVGARQAMMDWSPKIPVIIELAAKKLTKKVSSGRPSAKRRLSRSCWIRLAISSKSSASTLRAAVSRWRALVRKQPRRSSSGSAAAPGSGEL